MVMIFLCMLPALSRSNDDEYKKIGNVYVSDSVEVVKEADVNVLVPKGGQLQRQSSFMVKETPDEYAYRKFMEVEGYLKEIKNELEAQRKELNDLKEAVDSMREGKDKNKSQK